MHEWIQSFIDILIVVMAGVLVLFTLSLIVLHIITTSNSRRVERIKKRILRMLSVTQDLEYLREQIYHLLASDGEITALRDIRGIKSNRGTIAMTIVVEESSEEQKELLRTIINHDEWYTGHIHKNLHAHSIDRVGVFTKLIADLQIQGFEEEVYRNLYRWPDRPEHQEVCLMALFLCGCREQIIKVLSDPKYRLILSFRQLQELFVRYTGDHGDLYRELLAKNCDMYVTRACIHGIGTDGIKSLCPVVEPYLASESINLLIDSIRTLGKLDYKPAAEQIRKLIGHSVWSVRSVAATALAQICPENCYEEMLQCLCDKEWWVRFHAAEALITLPGHPTLMEDVTALNDRFAFEMMRFIRERDELLRNEVIA